MRTEKHKSKNRKLLIASGILFLVLSIVAFAMYKINENATAYELEQQEQQEAQEKRRVVLEQQKAAEEAKRAEEEAAKEVAEQTGFIGGIEYETGLSETSTETEVVAVMHKMTHQKVRAEEKIGAIPMVDDTINQVHDIVSNSVFKNKEKMLEIVKKWKNGRFDTINLDHNFFWELQGGTVGKAYGVLSPTEEKEFIKNNFPDYVQE
jgi:Na+-transporting methylmalonyl-CoA/oxaloacetate decarboxylase gamma subunit